MTRVIFVGRGSWYRIDVSVEGEARTVQAGSDMCELADAAMDLRCDLDRARALWLTVDDPVLDVIEDDVSQRFSMLVAS